MQRKVDIGSKAKVEVQWNVRPVDYSNEKANELRSKVAAKYGISKRAVHVAPNFIKKNESGKDVVATADIVQNIQDPRFQQELFKIYLAENEITDYDFDTILEIDNQLNSLIDYSVYDKFRRYKIEWVKWSNFLSYGENNYIDFNDLSGLVLLKSEPANQGGKTNFACDLIEFLLFGSVGSGKADVLKKIFNKHLPDATEVKVEGGIEIDGEHYIIRRTLTRPQRKKRTAKSVVTQKVEYFRIAGDDIIGLEDVENLESETNTKTSKVIKEAIGNKRDFNLVVSANSDNLKELVSMKDTERGKLLSRWIGLLPLEEKDIKAREKWNKEISPVLYSAKYNKEDLQAQVTSLNEQVSALEEKSTKLSSELTIVSEKITEYSEKKDGLQRLRQYVDPNISNLDITTLVSKQNAVIAEGKSLNAQIAQIVEEIASKGEINYSDEEFHTLTDRRVELNTEITTIKNDISNLRKQNDYLAKAEYCPTCGQKLVDVDNTQLIEANNAKVNDLIATGVEKNNELQNIITRLAEIEDMRQKYLEVNRLEVKKSTLDVTLANKRTAYTEVTNKIQELNRCKEAIEHNNLIDTEVNVLNVNIRTEQAIRDRISGEIQGHAREIAHLQKSISDYEIIIKKLIDEERLVKAWKIYLAMVGKNGICKMVLRNTLPIVNGELKRLLNDVCDFDVEVEIDDRNDITFSIIADDIKSDLSSGSGFEQTVAALALRAVLGNISTMSRPSFMLLDEVLGGVAKENYDNIKELYDRMLKDYSFIFQVTHLEDIADWHNTTVTVKKVNRVSTISVSK